jgi:hypothetical protein
LIIISSEQRQYAQILLRPFPLMPFDTSSL